LPTDRRVWLSTSLRNRRVRLHRPLLKNQPLERLLLVNLPPGPQRVSTPASSVRGRLALSSHTMHRVLPLIRGKMLRQVVQRVRIRGGLPIRELLRQQAIRELRIRELRGSRLQWDFLAAVLIRVRLRIQAPHQPGESDDIY